MSNKHFSTSRAASPVVAAAQVAEPEDFKQVGSAVRPTRMGNGAMLIARWNERRLFLAANGDLWLVNERLRLAVKVVACVETLLDVFEPHVGRKAIQCWERRVSA